MKPPTSYVSKARISSIVLFLFVTSSLWGQSGGVLRLHPQNSHYFIYQNKPTVIVGSGEHYGAVLNLDFNYDTYLSTLQKDGLNITRLFTGAYFERPGAFGIENNTLAPKEDKLVLPWKKNGDMYDLTEWNKAFFTRLHDFFQKAQQNGIIIEVTLFSAYYGAGWLYHPFNGKNNQNGTPTDLPAGKVNTLQNGSVLKFQEAYVRKIVQELNRYDNLYFEIQNEPWAEANDTVVVWNDYVAKDDLKEPGNYWKNTFEISSEVSRNWHKTVSGWIADAEKGLPKKHLIAHNIANFGLPVFVTDPRTSIYTFHYARPDAVTLNYRLNKVIGFNETGFAGKKDDTYRRQAWRFMMSGGGLFNHLDYSFSVGYEDGTDTTNNAPGGGSPTLRKHFRVLKTYLEGMQLASLQADNTFLHHMEGGFAYAMRDADSWIIYMEPFLKTPVKISLEVPKGKYTVEWTDVQTGRKLKTETMQIKASKAVLISPAGTDEKVVKIKKLN
jgi:hypothetical protein